MKRDLRMKLEHGIGLTELVVTMAISIIPISVIGVLLVGGQKNWHQTYAQANRKIAAQAQAATMVFGDIGRKADKDNSKVYSSGGNVAALSPAFEGNKMILGKEMEFVYWSNKPVKHSKSKLISSTLNDPSEYAYFYLDNEKLKVDYGPYPYSGRRKVSSTSVIADNVTDVKFVQTYANNVVLPSVRMELSLRDPQDGTVITVKSASLMRN